MSPDPRLIYVDDTSPLISYQGSWKNGGTYSSISNWYGGPFNDTVHALSGSGSFTFNFQGLSVTVVGSLQNSTLQASCTCFLDGNPLPSASILLDLNNVEICSVKDIASKTTPSNLTVVASAGVGDGAFLFDRIQYTPDASVLLDNATVVVDAFDDQIHYSSDGWITYQSDLGWQTSGLENAPSLTFDFIGTQITWMTTLPDDPVTASAQYSIDGGSLVPFQVATGSNSSTAPHYNVVSFKTSILSPGSHRLFVQYGANNPKNAAQLYLDKFVIQNLTILTVTFPTTSSTPIPTTPSTPSPTTTETGFPVSRKFSAGALSGIVIGSLVGGALIVFGLIWVIGFIKRKLAVDSLREQPTPYVKTYGDDQEYVKTHGNNQDRQLQGHWIT